MLVCTHTGLHARFTCLWRRCFLAGRGGGEGEGLRKVAMSSGQCTEGGLRERREHGVEGAEGRSEEEGERSFGRERNEVEERR